MRHRRLLGIVVTASLALPACGSSSSLSPSGVGTPRAGGSVVDVQAFAAGDPTHIDPALAEVVQETQIARLLYDGLTKTDATGDVKNAVAQSVSASADATQWTFRLRSDVKWENGDAVLPSDFKFAWQRVLDPSLSSNLTGRFSLIKGADAVASGASKDLSGVTADDAAQTLTVQLTSPLQDLPALVSTTAFSPLPQRVMAAGTDAYEKWESGVMIGNGAFRMASPWEHDRSIKLLRNDSYYGGVTSHKAYVDALEFRISKDLDSAYGDFETLDSGVGRIPPGQFDAAQSRYGSHVNTTPLLATEYWGFNLKDPVVGGDDNLKLRQAIAMVIDKKDIINKLYGGAREVATGWAPPGIPGYQVTAHSGDRNVEGAKDLIREWGKAAPTVRISFNSGAGHEEKAAIIQQNLKDIGINAVLDPIDQSAYNRAVGTGTVQFFRGTWNADYVSYDNFLTPLFASPPLGDQNVYHYSNSAFDALLQKGRTDADPVQRNAAHQQAERMMLADQVVVPLDWPTAGLVTSVDLQDVTVEPIGYVDYSEVWVRAE